MEQRKLGRHDVTVSAIGFGGLVASQRTQRDVNEEVARAIDRGVTYFDTAPSYGNCEELLGPALRPWRDRIVLACKTTERTAAGARRELERSLTRLQTDHFDLYQVHGLPNVAEARTALGPGGALEAILAAKSRGQVRLIGFSAHDEDAALLAMASGHFDTVMFPLNYVMHARHGFGRRVLAEANVRGLGIIALKALVRTAGAPGESKPYAKCWYIPEERSEVASLLLSYTLSLPGVVAAIPPGEPRVFRLGLDLAAHWRRWRAADAPALDAVLAAALPLFPQKQ